MRHLLGALCAALAIVAAGPGAAQTRLTMNYTTGESVSAFAAKEAGIFASHGLEVDLVPVVQNSNAPAALMSNSVQVGMIQVAVLLQAADSGLDFVAIAGGSENQKGVSRNSVVARTGSGIKTANDLVGRKVGVPGIGASIDIYFRAWLLGQGVAPSGVAIAETTFPAMADNLRSGNFDAVTPLEPFITRIVSAGIGYEVVNLIDTLPMDRLNALLFVSNRDWADKHQATVAQLRAAIAEADRFIAANPDKAREYISKYTKMPMEVLNTLPVPVVSPVLRKDSFDWWADTMQRLHMLQSRPDTAKLIFQAG